ncbi:hypothetical protein C1646_667064 [Rhizophagus diaphanus]|nr:hypothetical protein C1646_667064 [Rhizophagus diaphanus] [Rhizophagus sp. MUCL 43196]
MGLAAEERKAIALDSDELDSDKNAEDNATDIMIEDNPATPTIPTPNPVYSTSTQLPDLVKSPVDLAVIPEIIRKEEINKSNKETKREIQAVIYNIPEEMTMSSLWMDHALTEFMRNSCARSFKIIQTGKVQQKH